MRTIDYLISFERKMGVKPLSASFSPWSPYVDFVLKADKDVMRIRVKKEILTLQNA